MRIGGLGTRRAGAGEFWPVVSWRLWPKIDQNEKSRLPTVSLYKQLIGGRLTRMELRSHDRPAA